MNAAAVEQHSGQQCASAAGLDAAQTYVNQLVTCAAN